jgi:hypothetical protein
MSPSRWSDLDDIWSPDHPANRRTADALAPVAVQPAGHPDESTAISVAMPTQEAHSEETASRPRRVAELVARLRAGDISVRHALEQLLP